MQLESFRVTAQVALVVEAADAYASWLKDSVV